MAAPRFLCGKHTVGLFTTGPASGGGMENEETKDVARNGADEAKDGVIVGPELKGMRRLQKAVYDELNKSVVARAKTIVECAAKGNAGCIKLVTDCCESYERGLAGVEEPVSLGELLLKALNEEEDDKNEEAVGGE